MSGAGRVGRAPTTGTAALGTAALGTAALSTAALAAATLSLRLAASIADGIPVSLSDAITGLDRRNLSHLLAAIRHASGER